MITIDIYSDIGYNFNFPYITVYNHKVLEEGKDSLIVVYNQLSKISEELTELSNEVARQSYENIAFETMNIIQACETMLHILGCSTSEFKFNSNNLAYCDYEIIDEAKRRTFIENNARGYYD